MKLIILFAFASVAMGFPETRSLKKLDGIPDRNTLGLHPNIIGGKEVIPNSVPYQVSIQIPNGTLAWQHACGGSIISPTRIVTAAHCVDEPQNLRVVAGEHDLTKDEGHEQIVPVAKFTAHPLYDINVGDFDYAVVHLAKPLIFNKYVAPISLPKADYVPSGLCTAYGWGAINADQQHYPDTLQELSYPLVPREECAAIYYYETGYYNVTENMICAGAVSDTSVCRGDSGSPLICNGVFAGIASWIMRPCAQAKYPGVFSNVATGAEWIINN